MTNREKAEAAFKEELKFLSNNTKDIVLAAFDKIATDDFFKGPAAKSGRYHPEISNGDYGLIRHTKLVVAIANELMQAKKVNKDDRELIIAACLLHDIVKNGTRPEHKHYETAVDGHITSKHGEVLAMILAATNDNIPIGICRGVQYHMGTWSAPHTKTYFDKNFCVSEVYLIPTIVHLADYIASRKFLIMYDYVDKDFATRFNEKTYSVCCQCGKRVKDNEGMAMAGKLYCNYCYTKRG